MKSIILLMMAISILFASARAETTKTSSALDWEWRNPLHGGDSLNAVRYADGLWVAVGDHGSILTSTDRRTWSRQSVPSKARFLEIEHGAGLWVVIADEGEIFTSQDGQVWSQRRESELRLTSVAFGDGRWMAAGQAKLGGLLLLSSHDGMKWVEAPFTEKWNGGYGSKLRYGDGLWVLRGSEYYIPNQGNARDVVFTSTDGLLWTRRYTHPSDSGRLGYLGYGNGRWIIAMGQRGETWQPMVLTSTNGLDWVPTTELPSIDIIGFTGGQWIGSISREDGWHLASSTNAVDWIEQAPPLPPWRFSAIGHGDGAWVAAGGGGLIADSPDLVTWTARSAVTYVDLSGIHYANGLWAAIGGAGTILTSRDGVNWTLGNAGTSQSLSAVAYADGTWVAVGTAGAIFASTNAVEWTQRQVITTYSLADVAYANGLWVAVGGSWISASNINLGVILTSADATTWTERFLGPGAWPVRVAYGAGRWNAVGRSGSIVTSTNGQDWILAVPVNAAWLHGVDYAEGRWVAAGWTRLFPPQPSGWAVASRDRWINEGRQW